MIPQLAEGLSLNRIDKYIHDDAYAIDQKIDGKRLMMTVENGIPIPLNRRGSETACPPVILEEYSDTKLSGNWVFDGEILGDRYFVFDLPVTPQPDLCSPETPYIQRHEILERLFDYWLPEYSFLLPLAETTEQKQRLLLAASRQNSEGVMVKRKDAPYLSGQRSSKILKCKFISTCDCVITEVSRKGKKAVGLGMVTQDGTLVEVGAASIVGKRGYGIRVGDVVEVDYLYSTDDNRLFQPQLKRIRFDKKAEECGVWQLKYTDKTIVNIDEAI